MRLIILKKELVILLVVFGVLLMGTIGQLLVLIFCISTSLLGSSNAIRSLFISFLVFLINPAIAPSPDGLASLLRVVLLMVIALQGIYRLTFRQVLLKSVFHLTIFCISVAFLAVISSYAFSISFSKISQFYLSILGIFTCYFFTQKNTFYWVNYIYTFCTFIMVLSLPTMWLPQIGYFNNGFGFQGVTNQPQAYTVLLAPYGALILGNFFFYKQRNYLQIALVALLMVSLFLTKGRTGVLSILLGLIFIFIVRIFNRGTLLRVAAVFFRHKIYFYIVGGLVIFLPFRGQVLRGARDFALKNERHSGNLERSFENSRGLLILMQLKNIQNHPVTGIGFGLPSREKDLKVARDPVFNLPLSAPIEKGVFFISIVEEIGLIGTLFFLFLISSILISSLRSGLIEVQWMASAAFFTNIGEATLFSLGGMGLFVWLCITTGASLRNEKKQNGELPVY